MNSKLQQLAISLNQPIHKIATNSAIKEWQLFLKNSPLGVSFKGEPNGYFSAEFDSAMKAFENALSAKLNKSLQGTFYYAGTIRQSPAKIKEFLPTPQPTPSTPTAKDKPQPTQPSSIANFKTYLAKNKRFTGPINDEATPEFIAAIKHLEEMIAAAVQKLTGQKPNTANLIWSNNQLATTPEDVDKALAILAKQLKAKPIAKSGQATVENVQNSDPPPYDFLVHDFETGSPDESQQVGRRFVEIPGNMPVGIENENQIIEPVS